MKDAKTLLLEFLAAVTHGQNAAALFAKTLSPGSIWTSPSSPRTPTS
jgi:hypothetical protein